LNVSGNGNDVANPRIGPFSTAGTLAVKVARPFVGKVKELRAVIDESKRKPPERL
jgi:hypothetical protein